MFFIGGQSDKRDRTLNARNQGPPLGVVVQYGRAMQAAAQNLVERPGRTVAQPSKLYAVPRKILLLWGSGK